MLAQSTIFPTLFDLMGLRWAPAVADLDTLRLRNDKFLVRGRARDVANHVFDISSSQVDEFLRIPPAERRPDLYRTQETIPDVHPDGYRGPGLNLRDSHLREGYDPNSLRPETEYTPSGSIDQDQDDQGHASPPETGGAPSSGGTAMGSVRGRARSPEAIARRPRQTDRPASRPAARPSPPAPAPRAAPALEDDDPLPVLEAPTSSILKPARAGRGVAARRAKDDRAVVPTSASLPPLPRPKPVEPKPGPATGAVSDRAGEGDASPAKAPRRGLLSRLRGRSE